MAGRRQQRRLEWRCNYQNDDAIYRFKRNLSLPKDSAVKVYEAFCEFSYDHGSGDLTSVDHERLADEAGYQGDPEILWNALHVDYMVDGHIIDWDICAGAQLVYNARRAQEMRELRAALKSEVRVEEEKELVMATIGPEHGRNIAEHPDADGPREKGSRTLQREKDIPLTTCSAELCKEPLPTTPCSPSPPLPIVLHMTLLDEAPEALPFADFWTLYPKRTERFRAEREWSQMLPQERQAAMDVVRKMQWCMKAKRAPQVKYMNGGAIWLHQKRWMDWIDGAPFGWDDCASENCSSTFDALRAAYQQEAQREADNGDPGLGIGERGVAGTVREIGQSR